MKIRQNCFTRRGNVGASLLYIQDYIFSVLKSTRFSSSHLKIATISFNRDLLREILDVAATATEIGLEEMQSAIVCESMNRDRGHREKTIASRRDSRVDTLLGFMYRGASIFQLPIGQHYIKLKYDHL